LLNKLILAHDNAVNIALKHIEKEEIKARVQKSGKRKVQNTGNLIAAKFQHDVNRVLEPQLHTHSVVMNLTKIDGKYKALDTGTLLKKGSNTVKNLGQFYRQALKDELQKNGLELRDTDKEQSFFELKEVDDKLIKAFSSRTFEIRKEIFVLKKRYPNLTESQLSLRAFFGTRKAKLKDVDRNAIRAENIKIMEKYVDTNFLLKKLNKKNDLKKDVLIPGDREFAVLLDQVKYNIDNKYHRTLTNLANKISIKIEMPINKAFEKIKQKEQKDKKELKTMHQVVVLNLFKTRLDTEKLYSSFNNQNENKLIMEEKFENRRIRKTGDRDRLTQVFSRVSSELTKAKQTHFRDVGNTPTKGERRERGADTQRVNDVVNRDAGRDIKTSQAVTLEDVKLAEQGYRESVKHNNKEREL